MYHLYIVTTEEETMLLDMYCAGHSALWNMFFGWRRTKQIAPNLCWYYYRIPKKIYNLSQAYAKTLGIETI